VIPASCYAAHVGGSAPLSVRSGRERPTVDGAARPRPTDGGAAGAAAPPTYAPPG